MQLCRMVPQPAPPNLVIGPARRDDFPEARSVAEHPEVRQLVDHDRFESLRWSEDKAPREGQPALARGAPPSCPLVAEPTPRQESTPRAACVTADLVLDGVPGARLEERGQERSRSCARRAWRARITSSSSTGRRSCSTDDRRSAGAAPARSGAGGGRLETGSGRRRAARRGQRARHARGRGLQVTAKPRLAFARGNRRCAAQGVPSRAGSRAARSRRRHGPGG